MQYYKANVYHERLTFELIKFLSSDSCFYGTNNLSKLFSIMFYQDFVDCLACKFALRK